MAKHSRAAPDETRELDYIVDLNDNDVLLGRGQPILNYSGNVQFRKLIQERKEQYTSTGKHAVKDEIAREILDTIEARGGRFVRKVDEAERDVLQLPDHVLHAWRIVDEQTRLSKVKQALREQVGKDGNNTSPGHKNKAPRKRSSSDENPPPSMLEASHRKQGFLNDANQIAPSKRARSVNAIPAGLTGNAWFSQFQLPALPASIGVTGQTSSSLTSAGFSDQNRVFLPPNHMTDDNSLSGDPNVNLPLHGLSFAERQELQRRLLLQQRQQLMALQRRQALENAQRSILPPWSLETAVQQYLITQQRLQQDHMMMQQQAVEGGAVQNQQQGTDSKAEEGNEEDHRKAES